MFKRSFRSTDPHTSRVDKSARLKSRKNDTQFAKLQQSVEDAAASSPSQRSRDKHHHHHQQQQLDKSSYALAPSPIITLTVGKDGRIFAAHEDVLCQAPFFEAACRKGAYPVKAGANNTKRILLPDEEPEVFSAVLEYLYKGDYYPRLIPGKHRDSWELEDGVGTPNLSASPLLSEPSGLPTPRPSPNLGSSRGAAALQPPPSPHISRPEVTISLSGSDEPILRDTAIYCAADRYGLDELKRLSLRKQGLQSGIDVGTILRSAQYAYANTPDSDSRLRAHYLALIIRCRRTFKRSGTMQAEMERGGSKLYFDLFVAMCNHLDDVIEASNSKSPRLV